MDYTVLRNVTDLATTPTQQLTVRLTDEWAKSQMARSVPGSYWSDEHKAHMVIDPSPRSAAVILRLFPELGTEHPELLTIRDQLLTDVRPFDNATPFGASIENCPEIREALWNTACPGLTDAGCPGASCAKCGGDGLAKYTVFNFQDLDLSYLCAVLEAHRGAYIGWERGLGKSLGAAIVTTELGLDAVLVVCPNTAKEAVWGAELARFLPGYNVIVMRNTKAQRERDLEMAKALRKAGKPVILVLHYEALDIIHDAKRSSVTWKQLGEWDIVVADEAHRLSNPKAKMVKALKKIPTKLKLALSGSIIQNHAEELFSPLQWLFPERYRSKWRDWNDRYLDYVENGWSKICVGVKPERIEEMRQELGVFMVYRRKEDELPDLPMKTEQTLYVELSPAQRKHYDELLRENLTQLDSGEVIKASEGLVMLTRLRQIATGLDLFDTGVTDSSKCDLAIEMIEDTPDEATVVFTWYKANAVSMAERLEAKGIGCFLVTGDVTQKRRNEYIQRFTHGEGRVFIGTLSTLGESVNLQRANNVIRLDRSWNPGTNTQATDRIYRIGQDKPCIITDLVAKNTVDEYKVMPAIAGKEALRRLILGGL